ncbi:MAG: hypothetical protein PSX81_05100 [bacterium]|nr:hypothetical protein [bacterium]
MKKNLILIVLFAAILRTTAQNGTLDLSFNSTGIINSSDETANGITTDKNNKVMVIGHDRESSTLNIFVKRYLTNGNLDNSFGTNGRLNIDLNDDYDYGRCIKALDNGKYLISGQNSVGPYFRPFVARITSDGIIDSTFGTDGICLLSAPLDNSDAWAFEVSPSGSIYAAGYITTNWVTQSIIWKVNPNGTINSAFGNNGSVVINVNTNAERLLDIAMNDTGKMIVGVGTSYNGSYNSATIVMLDTNGNMNTNFNASGYLKYRYNTSETRLYGVSIADKQLVFAGNYINDSSYNTHAIVCAFLFNGALNSSFGNAGIWTDSVNTNSSFTEILKDCKDNFFLGGYVSQNSNVQFRVGKITSKGLMDANFGNNGYFSRRINNNYDEVIEAMAFSSDSAIVVCGRINSGDLLTTSGIMKLKVNGCSKQNSDGSFIAQTLIEKSIYVIYPNPLKSGMPLYFKANSNEVQLNELTFQIISYDGKALFSPIKLEDQNANILPDSTYLAKGIYQLIIRSATSVQVQSFVVE